MADSVDSKRIADAKKIIDYCRKAVFKSEETRAILDGICMYFVCSFIYVSLSYSYLIATYTAAKWLVSMLD